MFLVVDGQDENCTRDTRHESTEAKQGLSTRTLVGSINADSSRVRDVSPIKKWTYDPEVRKPHSMTDPTRQNFYVERWCSNPHNRGLRFHTDRRPQTRRSQHWPRRSRAKLHFRSSRDGVRPPSMLHAAYSSVAPSPALRRRSAASADASSVKGKHHVDVRHGGDGGERASAWTRRVNGIRARRHRPSRILPRADVSRGENQIDRSSGGADADLSYGYDDDDLEYQTYADVSSSGGEGVHLSVSRAFTADVAPEALAGATGSDRGVLEYVRLPAEEYNVLDSNAVTRVEPETFRVTAGVQKILFLEVEPVGLIRIVPTPSGCDQILEGAVMNDAKAARMGKKDSKLLAAMNGSLRDLRMRNRISAVKGPAGDEKIRCQIDVYGTFTEGPFAMAGGERLHNLLTWCLGAVMPWFLSQLTKDYGDWAAERPRGRQKVNVAQVTSEILGGSKGNLPPGITEVACEA